VTFLDHYRGDGPLRDVTVLDFSQMMMGPLATQMFGDLGALVIKVERPGAGEWERSYLPQGVRIADESPYLLAMNRNKIGLAADLKNADDRARILELVAISDVVVHNFRPGVMERLGFGYEDLSRLNPRLVYASGSGYGEEGPWVARPGQDLLVQSASGLAWDSGPGSVPPVPSATPIVDAATGFLLAFNVVSAVLSARSTGEGRRIHASLLGTALLMQCQQALVTLNTDLRYDRSDAGLAAPWTNAPYGVYETADGYVTMSMVANELLAKVLDLPDDLLGLSDKDVFDRRDEVVSAITPQLRTETSEHWLAKMAKFDIWAAPVLSLDQILQHEQVKQNGYLDAIPTPDGGEVTVVGMGCTVSGVPTVNRLAAPRVGQHTDEIWAAMNASESDTEAAAR
jgi:crotonobetainyl-CoA:carnitine CoA-transferase CaiB-like acyl-CoA transferase